VWPFQTSALEGSKIAVTDVGRGPVLLFVHTGFWSFIWRDVILRLAPDFRCVCFDAPGTGQSDRLPTSSISLERASRALTAVIEALNLTDITLVFHDLGGPSGIAGAARMPDRIRGLRLRPIRGRERVAHFVVSALRNLVPHDRVSRLLEVNGQPGVVNYISQHPHSVVIVDVADERIHAIYVVSNPDKLEGVTLR